MDWSRIEDRHKSLVRFLVRSGDNLSWAKIPAVLKLSIGVASAVFDQGSECQKIGIVFPRSFDAAFWVAAGFVLNMMEKDFLPAIEQLPPFSIGQKLFLDNQFVVQYDGELKINDQRFIWLRQGGPSTRLTLELRERLRLQPLKNTKKPLTKPRSIPPPPLHFLDQILGIKSYGNRSIFHNRAILVSVLKKAREFASDTFLCPSNRGKEESGNEASLIELFQWGGIDREGVSEPWHQHQVDVEPVLYVASDLSSVREHLRSHSHSTPLIILDGEDSFYRDLDALDEITDTGCPVIAVLEHAEKDSVKLLNNRSFRVWAWSEKEIGEIQTLMEKDIPGQEASFHQFQRALRNYARQIINDVECSNSPIQDAACKLETLSSELASNPEHVKAIQGELYGCLLSLCRLLCPVGYAGAEEWLRRISKHVQRIESELSRNVIWFSKTAHSVANELLIDLKRILCKEAEDEHGKPEVLQELISGSLGKTIAVILSDSNEIKFTAKYWREHLGSFSTANFCCPLTINSNVDYSRIIVCGWLGTQKMRDILDSCLAPEITILTFPFERAWLHSAMRRWKQTGISVLKKSEKMKFLKLGESEFPVEEEAQIIPETEEGKKSFDINEFELRLRFYRRKALAEKVAGGQDTVEARLIELSEDRFAFLTETHRIPVVTDFVTGKAGESDEIPRRKVSELKIGDHVIFREGSQGDLIREIADEGLKKAGKTHLREVAGLWKRVLRKFIEVQVPTIAEKMGIKDFGWEGSFWIAATFLKEKGCNRHPQTIRNWLTDDDLIGPRNERDLDMILQVTADSELDSRLEEVRRAIKEVRGAHIAASHFLVRRLLTILPQHLEAITSESLKIEVEGIGRAIVTQVNDIGAEVISVDSSKANRLLREEI